MNTGKVGEFLSKEKSGNPQNWKSEVPSENNC